MKINIISYDFYEECMYLCMCIWLYDTIDDDDWMNR